MSLLKKNIAANFIGNIWTSLMSLAFIPLYIHFMGIESYGLVGIFATLQALFGLLDMGLGATLNREMARLSILPDKAQEMHNLLRTLEVIYWTIAVLIGTIVFVLAPLIAYHWVKPGQLAPETIQQAVRIMGFATAFQWPLSFYAGGLMGLQRQVLLNVINMIMATIRGGGAVLILWLISPTIQAFFSWQIAVGLTNTILVGGFLWHTIPDSLEKARFNKWLLRDVWRFAAGMTGITVMAIILTQLDKIILSKLLTLEMFGYYTLASVVAMSLYRLIGPVSGAVFPRLTQLVSLGDEEGLKKLYHQSCQLMSVLILPVAVVVALFSKEILLLWTQNPTTADKAHLLVTILVIGTSLNGLMHIPYDLQLAHGWTKLAFYSNLISAALLVPLIVVLTNRFAALGGASVWVILNSGYVLVNIQIMHKWILPGEKRKWYVKDVGTPLVAALVTASIGRLVFRNSSAQPIILVSLIICSIVTLFMTAIAAPTVRSWILDQIYKFRVAYGS